MHMVSVSFLFKNIYQHNVCIQKSYTPLNGIYSIDYFVSYTNRKADIWYMDRLIDIDWSSINEREREEREREIEWASERESEPERLIVFIHFVCIQLIQKSYKVHLYKVLLRFKYNIVMSCSCIIQVINVCDMFMIWI